MEISKLEIEKEREIIKSMQLQLKVKDKEIATLKKALELACETIKEIMPDKPLYICGQAIAERLGIPMTSEIKDYEYFIEQAKESLK